MVERDSQRERHESVRPDNSRDDNTNAWWQELAQATGSHNSLLRNTEIREANLSAQHLPRFELFDSLLQESRIAQTFLLERFQSHDRIARPTIERSGNDITRFVDINGNEYTRRGDHYSNARNPAQTEGVMLRFDQNGAVRMKDRETGIVRTTTADGTETTDYAAVNGGKTTRRIEGNLENISIEDRGGRSRNLILERNENGAMVRSYTDGSGVTYSFNNQRNSDGKPLYSAVDRNGRELGRNYTVNADRSGNVLVNNYDQPDSPQFARRELNNGMTVTSGKTADSRVVTDAAGNRLDASSDQVRAALRTQMISEVPANLDMQRNLDRAASFRTQTEFAPVAGSAAVSLQMRSLFDGGDWDPKTTGQGNNVTNMEYEAYGNWQYGYLGRASGFSEQYLREQAGRFQYSPDPRWGHPGFLGYGGTGTQGDDPEDVRFMDRGFASYRAEHPEHARESLQASTTNVLLRMAAAPFQGILM